MEITVDFSSEIVKLFSAPKSLCIFSLFPFLQSLEENYSGFCFVIWLFFCPLTFKIFLLFGSLGYQQHIDLKRLVKIGFEFIQIHCESKQIFANCDSNRLFISSKQLRMINKGLCWLWCCESFQTVFSHRNRLWIINNNNNYELIIIDCNGFNSDQIVWSSLKSVAE